MCSGAEISDIHHRPVRRRDADRPVMRRSTTAPGTREATEPHVGSRDRLDPAPGVDDTSLGERARARADRDETVADTAQTTAERDQTSAGRNRWPSDRDHD